MHQTHWVISPLPQGQITLPHQLFPVLCLHLNATALELFFFLFSCYFPCLVKKELPIFSKVFYHFTVVSATEEITKSEIILKLQRFIVKIFLYVPLGVFFPVFFFLQ